MSSFYCFMVTFYFIADQQPKGFPFIFFGLSLRPVTGWCDRDMPIPGWTEPWGCAVPAVGLPGHCPQPWAQQELQQCGTDAVGHLSLRLGLPWMLWELSQSGDALLSPFVLNLF